MSSMMILNDGIVGLQCVFLCSSRRRHTRCYRDWSSDVCSSDLDALELEIEKFVFGNHDKMSVPTAKEVGKAFRIDDAQGRYVVFVKNTFPKELTLDGFKIVVDCANGAAYKVAPEVLYELGAEVISLGVNPDGENINLRCGPLHY